MTEFRSWAVAVAEGAQRAGMAPNVIENLQQALPSCPCVAVFRIVLQTSRVVRLATAGELS